MIQSIAQDHNEGPETHGTRTRHHFAAALSLAVILSLTFGVVVGAQTVYRSSVAANGPSVATPSASATASAASVKAGTGGSARWGFVLAIGAAIAIFIVGGLFVAMRARGDYLDEQRRNAAMPREDES
ncbi:MAG: hypothetical protein M3Y58_18115 [Chloroflexota bacterium]|nr:hypothetical protein [Chloroflexota bacterium]